MSLSSHGCCPRGDLYTGNSIGASATHNLVHFKSTKILPIMWKEIAPSCINENAITKDVGNKIRFFSTRITK
ncbi:hypothetical protein B296_00044297 [Ensete ventricosum]|uniref:Uncharacterized protein n=1 Tax=Ensete ventricosum TaxID=4639 RepID=A0A426XEQ8_ENSVE|nr:hypothetical protein B296_00044297 [Ensete ventricosum]